MDEQDLKQIETMMVRVVGVFAEDVLHKLDLLLAGQQALCAKSDSQFISREGAKDAKKI